MSSTKKWRLASLATQGGGGDVNYNLYRTRACCLTQRTKRRTRTEEPAQSRGHPLGRAKGANPPTLHQLPSPRPAPALRGRTTGPRQSGRKRVDMGSRQCDHWSFILKRNVGGWKKKERKRSYLNHDEIGQCLTCEEELGIVHRARTWTPGG